MVKLTMNSKYVLYKVKNIFFNLNIWQFAVLLYFMIVIKNGVHPIGKEWIDWLYDASADFPTGSSYLSFSILPITEVRVLKYPAYFSWWVINLFLTFSVSLFFIFTIIKTYGAYSKKALIIFCTLPLFISPYLYLGHYDLFSIFAAFIAWQSQNKIIIFMASLIAVFTNVEQSIVTAISLFLLYIWTQDKNCKTIMYFWCFSSFLGYIFLSINLNDSFISNRASSNLGFATVFQESLGIINLLVFALFGVAWFWVFLGLQKVRHFAILISIIFIPLFISMATVDRTRVGVAVGALPILLFFKYILENSNILNLSEKYFYQYLIVYLFIPQFFVDNGGVLRLPYKELFSLFV